MKIYIASNIDPNTIKKLQERHDVICAFGATPGEMKSSITDCEILVFRSGVQISAEVMECAPNLKLIIRAGSGIDNLDMEYVLQQKIELIRIPEPGAQAVAEMSFALFLALSRELLKADRSMRSGKWIKHTLKGRLMNGKTLGIIGVGNIGLRIAQLALSWEMRVVGCVGSPTPQRVAEMDQQGIRLMSLNEVVSTSDYVSINVPMQESTRNLISSDVLASMKPGAFLVNLARGGVLDEAALFNELINGNLGGAALDVHEKEGDGNISPLAELTNVILTPHIGATTIDSQRQIGHRIFEIIESVATHSH